MRDTAPLLSMPMTTEPVPATTTTPGTSAAAQKGSTASFTTRVLSGRKPACWTRASYTIWSSGVSQPDIPHTLRLMSLGRTPAISIRRVRSRKLPKALALPTALKLVGPP